MTKFFLVWLGQTVSLFGTQLTGFALGISVYQRTNSITLLGLISFAAYAPEVMLMPFTGVLVDRMDRRKVMLLGHVAAGVCSLLLATAYLLGHLSVGLIFFAVTMSSISWSPQGIAFRATSTVLAPKNMMVRANGMMELSYGMGQLAAPLLAAVVLAKIGLSGVLIVDVLSFVIAILALLAVKFPPLPSAASETTPRRAIVAEALFGWKYMCRKRGLVLLTAIVAMSSFHIGLLGVLIKPLVLGFSDVTSLGTILSTGGIGMVLGSILMVAWSGPRKRFRMVLVGVALEGAILIVAASRPPSALLAGIVAFVLLFIEPVVHTLSNTIVQQAVEPDVQGRVFAFRQLMVFGPMPIAAIVAGPLVGGIFQPWIRSEGAAGSLARRLVPPSATPGIALLFAMLGAISLLVVLAAAFSKSISIGDRTNMDNPAVPPLVPAPASSRQN